MRIVVLGLALVGCGAFGSGPPPFAGRETASWTAFEVKSPELDEARQLLPKFEACARDFGCFTDHLGTVVYLAGRGETRLWYGVTASCDEGTIAILKLRGGRVRVGCEKPMTRDGCEALLQRISVGGEP
jgi:hypothetical protein